MEIMEIYFSSPLNTLDHFFDSENINIASKYIISIDLTHFDYSNLNSINYLFKGCERLKSVDFPNFKEISGMEGLFQNCESLQLLDLSSVNTSSVTHVSKMLIGCNSLKALYIPGLDLSKVNNANNLFIDDGSGSMQLKYFYVIGSTFSESILNEIKSSLNEIIVCQDNNQVSSEGNNNFKYIEKCCNFNSEKGKCVTSNYITIHYPNNDTNGQGYQFSIPENYKNLIEFINKGDSILTKNFTNNIC